MLPESPKTDKKVTFTKNMKSYLLFDEFTLNLTVASLLLNLVCFSLPTTAASAVSGTGRRARPHCWPACRAAPAIAGWQAGLARDAKQKRFSKQKRFAVKRFRRQNQTKLYKFFEKRK